MTVTKNSIITVKQKNQIANAIYNDWSGANVFVVIGREAPWETGDTLVDVPQDTTDYVNAVWRNGVAMKKVTAADMAFVIPRIDWQTGVVYDEYESEDEMFSTITLTQTAGSINANNTRVVQGTNTNFSVEYAIGDFVKVLGDGIIVGPQIREVISIASNTSMNVNTAFTGNIVSNAIFKYEDSYPAYARQFYVRNKFDQIFKCLFNDDGAVSTIMPQITIGGQLPNNPYIETADGYKWKYLYTIPPGQKQKFFSTDWMPVFSSPVVVAAAVDGQIDIVKIINGGSGYNQNVASNTASILTVSGDGTGANLSAKVDANGTIFDINILDGGQNYTIAEVVIEDGATGNNGNLQVVIGPQGGHGFNPAEELGAGTLMMSLELSKDENDTIPTIATVGSDEFDYRQISLVKNPKLDSGAVASNTNYSLVGLVTVQVLPAGQFFSMDETVFQGNSLDEATFSGTVVFWDNTNNIVHLNNLAGDFQILEPLRGTVMTTPVTAFQLTESVVKHFSGKVLYINNVTPVVRSEDQSEQIKLLLSF